MLRGDKRQQYLEREVERLHVAMANVDAAEVG